MLNAKRAVLATASIAVLVFATAAAAQTETTSPPPANAATPPPAKSKAKDQSTGVSELVITGSRIKTSEFNSASPVTVLTPEQAQLEGKADIAELLQSLPVAENNVQINNFFTGFVVTGGPGVNTLSLRGLGAQRTLFLINGQRLGPAGVGGTVGPVDLNTLNFPQAEIEDIQILTDGLVDLRFRRHRRRRQHHHQDQLQRGRHPRVLRPLSGGRRQPVPRSTPASVRLGRAAT